MFKNGTTVQSFYFLNPKFQACSYFCVAVQSDLSDLVETPVMGFLATQLTFFTTLNILQCLHNTRHKCIRAYPDQSAGLHNSIDKQIGTRIVFLQKKTRCLPLLGRKKIKTSLNKITNRNNAHFSSKQSSSYPVKIPC